MRPRLRLALKLDILCAHHCVKNMFVSIKSIKSSFFTHRTSFSFNKSFLTIARIISSELLGLWSDREGEMNEINYTAAAASTDDESQSLFLLVGAVFASLERPAGGINSN